VKIMNNHFKDHANRKKITCVNYICDKRYSCPYGNFKTLNHNHSECKDAEIYEVDPVNGVPHIPMRIVSA